MKNKLTNLEFITEEELNNEKLEAQYNSTSLQNYHCMLNG